MAHLLAETPSLYYLVEYSRLSHVALEESPGAAGEQTLMYKCLSSLHSCHIYLCYTGQTKSCGQAQIQGVEKQTSSPNGSVCEVTSQECGCKEGKNLWLSLRSVHFLKD